MGARQDLETLAAKNFPAADGDQLDIERRRIVMGCYDALRATQRGRIYLEFIPPNIWEVLRLLPDLPNDVETLLETGLKMARSRLQEALNTIDAALDRTTHLRYELWLRELAEQERAAR